MRRVILISILIGLLVLSSAVAGGQGEGEADAAEDDVVLETVGPDGSEPVSYDAVELSAGQAAEVRDQELTAAILMHTTSDFSNALIAGAEDVFGELGIDVAVVTDAEMDPNKQRTDVETALALDPDIIITLVIDPVSGAAAFRSAIDDGVELVFLSNLPQDYEHPDDYAGIVTSDLFAMGEAVAEMIAENLDGEGTVGLMYHDANYYVTNQRDQAVETVLRRRYPDIEIVARSGIANPNDGEVVASAMITQNPDIDAIYAPWDTIAEGVVAATRSADRDDISVFTMDLGANNALDMVRGGNVAGVVTDLPYTMGQTLARMGVLASLGESTPPFVTAPALKVTEENILEAWQQALRQDAPQEVREALQD